MLNTQTPSQVTEQYMYNQYPCLQQWISFVQKASVKLAQYDATSCSQISQINNAAMKTIEYMQQNDSNANVVRVMRMLNDLYDSAWNGWTSFASQANNAYGTRSLGTTQDVLQSLTVFQTWDNALNPSPSFNPPVVLNTILEGITP
ncbi:hypothetical protein LSG31_00300 [Fodinisporobacter ferrooxydans]|uniref:Uncharacterized protein n=1 Tax=Fodinisporobacter ferrooxydans TaxID=2901836 RepID=A0ABY4CK29_9BACL|nr:hypothetical protein LSG31_00300 [Alicyclobacillaceae bacterium MYW30-H2]